MAWNWDVKTLVPLELMVHDLAGTEHPGPQRELDEDLSLVWEVLQSIDFNIDFPPCIPISLVHNKVMARNGVIIRLFFYLLLHCMENDL